MNIYSVFQAIESRRLRPDLVVLNSCNTMAGGQFLIDDVDGIVMALLSCGNVLFYILLLSYVCQISRCYQISSYLLTYTH